MKKDIVMLNPLYDPKLTQDYHSEYLKLVNFYHNIDRKAIYMKYYNINYAQSLIQGDLDTTYDIYNVNGVKFDVYDLTPGYSIQPITNRSSVVPDLKGSQLDATTTVVIYTLERPAIYDLITFYPPIGSGEIFRVMNFSTPVNALHSAPNKVCWFELELEYAPIKSLDGFKIENQYVYDTAFERYLPKEEYTKNVDKLETFAKLLEQLQPYYNAYHDLYAVGGVIPIVTNELLILLKRQYSTKLHRLFEKFKSPYGYMSRGDMYYGTMENMPFVDDTNDLFYAYDIKTGEALPLTWSDKTDPNTEYEKVLDISRQLYLEML